MALCTHHAQKHAQQSRLVFSSAMCWHHICLWQAVTFADVRHVAVQPLRVPGSAFAWLELISPRNLMPKLLLAPNHKGWPSFQRLLLALLRFLEPYLRNAELTDAVRLLYKVCCSPATRCPCGLVITPCSLACKCAFWPHLHVCCWTGSTGLLQSALFLCLLLLCTDIMHG